MEYFRWRKTGAVATYFLPAAIEWKKLKVRSVPRRQLDNFQKH